MYNESYARHISPIGLDDFGVVGDGVTDDINAFNAAISHLSELGGGVISLERGRTYLVSGGILPANNITINGNGSTIKLSEKSVAPMFSYNSDTTLVKFNLYDVILDGNNVAQDIIHVDQPNPVAPTKTWSYSVLFNVEIKNSGAIGLYCPIPGRIRLIGCRVSNNDIGLAWDREHIDTYNTSVELNRIGVRSTGNHFVWIHGVISHNTEAGWTTVGAGLGTYTDIYEGAFIGCTFIDNGTISLDGPLTRCRITSSRFLDADVHINDCEDCLISDNHFGGPYDYAIDNMSNDTNISNNIFVLGSYGIRTKINQPRQKIDGNEFISLTQTAITLVKPDRCTVTNNRITDGVVGIYVDARSGSRSFDITNNHIHNPSQRGIHFVGPNSGAGDINDWMINNNRISWAQLEGMLLVGNSGSLASSISGNHITDCNLSNTAGTHGIKSERQHISSRVCDNIIRNTATGKMDHAILFTDVDVVGLLFSGNVARNMLGSYSYDLPTGTTVGDNIGTFAP